MSLLYKGIVNCRTAVGLEQASKRPGAIEHTLAATRHAGARAPRLWHWAPLAIRLLGASGVDLCNVLSRGSKFKVLLAVVRPPHAPLYHSVALRPG